MQRKLFHTLLSASLKPVGNIFISPRLHFHLTKSILSSKSSSWTEAIERRTDFTNLSPDEFGNLQPKQNLLETVNRLPAEEDEEERFDSVTDEGRKKRRHVEYYEGLISQYLDEKRLVEALEVLETKMLKIDKVIPRYHTYSLLINGCARAGFCEKAFELYQKMKERNIKRTAYIYSGLFNACANSPFPADAVNKLTTLRKSLAENGVELNAISYHAMIKAYARLKDPHSAFLVADEMLCKGHALEDTTCSFLLQACISDSEAGLRHALLLWHKMRSKKIKPNTFLYNLFVRCIRDCGFGTEEDLKDVLQRIIAGKRNEAQLIGERRPWSIKISWKTSSKQNDGTAAPDPSEIADNEENIPNLLAAKPHLGNIVSINEIKTPSDRLLLLGGFKTLYEQMKNDNVKPDIKTFTQLLDIMPSTEVSENHLLEEIKTHKVHLDIDFCNMLIKKRALRRDYLKAREVLNLIQANYLYPDIVTFGVLAMSCTKVHEAEELVAELRNFGYRLNMPILGGMLKQACSLYNFDYVLYIMNLTQRIKMDVSEEFMNMLESLDTKMTRFIKRKKKGDKNIPSFLNQPKFLEKYRMWKEYYDRFKTEVNLYVPPHPYEQFRKINYEPAEGSNENGERDRQKKTINNHGDSKKFRRKSQPKSPVNADANSDEEETQMHDDFVEEGSKPKSPRSKFGRHLGG